MAMTTSKNRTGEFAVLWNDEPTAYTIFNGDAGMSGNGRNTYGILNATTGKLTVIGSLQKAKRTVEYWLSKK
jgi:hypothetical protein